MPYSFREFAKDKRFFFEQVTTTEHAALRAQQHSYRFAANNELLLEQEFKHTYSYLQRNGQDREKLWFYCFYCSLTLESYYRAYGKVAKAEEYRQASEAIRNRNNPAHATPIVEETFLQSLRRKISADLGALVSVPLHTSKIRDWVAFANITRLQVVFCRITVRESLLLAKQLHWLDGLESMLGKAIDVDGMVSVLNAPADVFNALSVGLFAARFIINTGMLLKHTLMPSDAEQSLTMTERFCAELNARHGVFINDVVWGTVNGITNYASYFNISGPAANWILSGFLFFDVAMLLYSRKLAEQDYLTKKEQYLTEDDNCGVLLARAAGNNEDIARLNEQRDLLSEQLAQLELDWQVTSARNEFNVGAAVLFMSGYPASFLLATPLAVPVSFFACTVAVAMYLSEKMYGTYQEKSLLFQRVKDAGGATPDAEKALCSARNNLMISLTKNTFMPMFLLTTVAVSMPAALLFTTLYLSYECGKGYFAEEQAASMPALG